MQEIIVISGKGGTGKTSISAAFSHLMQNGIVCDLDVDAPDLHIILDPEHKEQHAFISGSEASIQQDSCTGCGLCFEICRFEAVVQHTSKFSVDPMRCEGCGVCKALCPAQAITMEDKHCGTWYRSESRFGQMFHAQLFPGEENSGRLVTLLKQKAREFAKEQSMEIILCDGSPGIGCPVISSLSGASIAVAVVEPTPSGRHDFERVAQLCDHFRIPVNVVINKADLNEEECLLIKKLCEERGYRVAGMLPFSQDVTDAMIATQALTETDSPLRETVKDIWKAVLSRLESMPSKQTLIERDAK